MKNQKYQVTKTTKIAFTNAFNTCLNRLRVKGYIINHKTSTNISWRSKIFSQKMYDVMELMMNELSKCPDDEPMSIDEKILRMFGIECLNKTKENIDIDSKNILKNILFKATKQADDCISINSWSNTESSDEEFEKSNEYVKIKKEEENYHKYDSMINNPLFSPRVVISNTKKIQQQMDLLVKKKNTITFVNNQTLFTPKLGNAYKAPYELRSKAVNITFNNPTLEETDCDEKDNDSIKHLRFINTKRIINKLVHNKCLEYFKRSRKRHIRNPIIRSFGLEVKKQYSSLKFVENFNPTPIWAQSFKAYYFPFSKNKGKI